MSKEKTKVLNLSLTEKEIESLEKISREFFGTPNKSGMVRYWITQALKNARTSLPDEDVSEPIQNALYATNAFTTDQCSNITDGILLYLKDAGFEIVKGQ